MQSSVLWYDSYAATTAPASITVSQTKTSWSQTPSKVLERILNELPPVCESDALCSSIKVSSFAFPVIRLIAAGRCYSKGFTFSLNWRQKEGGAGSGGGEMPLWSGRVDKDSTMQVSADHSLKPMRPVRSFTLVNESYLGQSKFDPRRSCTLPGSPGDTRED